MTTAHNGQEALDILLNPQNHFEVLLSDLHMPHMNGLELIQAVQTKPELKHLIIISETFSSSFFFFFLFLTKKKISQ